MKQPGKSWALAATLIMPAGMKHYAWTPAETIIQIDGIGPFVINYVNPEDDPRKAKK